VRGNATFLHTEPHHDDIMLGYLPGVVRHIREHTTRHFFAALTSGFTAVTNDFMLKRLLSLREAIRSEALASLLASGYFAPSDETGKNRDVWQYLDGVAAGSASQEEEGNLRRLLRNIINLYGETDIDRLEGRVDELIGYFKTQYAGKKDLPHVQRLKGMVREWEADCLWGYFGWHSESIQHLRLGFYTGDIFTEEPTQERDAMPILALLEKVDPDIVSVALDPEASGPDTHYKTLQAMTEALKIHRERSGRKDIRIWGYRNIWYRFHPSEANMFIPVSLNMFALQNSAFKNSYVSQKDASFPSYEYDGPFSDLAQKIQVEQYQMLKTCLGRAFFYEHKSALIRATRGFVFLKEMGLDEFVRHSRALMRYAENI
jgi:glucosamine-6-phosphate deaminase